MKTIVDSATPEFHHILNNCYGHLKYQLNIVNRKLNTFYPEKRQKRGLINPLGSLVKFVSGNMDNDDAQEIHNNILKLETDQNKIVTKLNNHISLSKNIMSNINDSLTLIVKNQINVENKTNELIRLINKGNFDISHFYDAQEILDQIKYNLDSLLNYLEEIENAVTFANLEVVHPSIISYQDLKDIINELYSIYNHKQLLFSNINDISKYYNVIKIKVHIINEKIMFSLDFPLIHPETFDHYHLYSIPNSNQSTIIPPATYLSVSDNVYQYSNEECIDLQSEFLCKSTNLLPLQKEEECLTSILSTDTTATNCQQIPIKITEQVIVEINEAHYIGIFPKQRKIQTSCKQNTIASLQGTYLIFVPPNCSIKISSYVYANKLKTIPGHPMTLEKINMRNSTITQVEKLQLDKVPLDKLHQLQLQELEELPIESISLHEKYSKGSIIGVIILSLVILLYFTLKTINKLLQKKEIQQGPTPSPRAFDETQVVPP